MRQFVLCPLSSANGILSCLKAARTLSVESLNLPTTSSSVAAMADWLKSYTCTESVTSGHSFLCCLIRSRRYRVSSKVAKAEPAAIPLLGFMGLDTSIHMDSILSHSYEAKDSLRMSNGYPLLLPFFPEGVSFDIFKGLSDIP